MGESRCLRCFVEGQAKKEWTCACGYGYWDAVKQKFIPGIQVRNGKALSRTDYEAHLQKCSACRKKAEDDDLVLPTIEPPWPEGDYGPDARPWEDLASEPERHQRPPGQVIMFLPSEDIDANILTRYIVEKVDARGHVRTGTHTDGRSGFFVTAKTKLTVDMLSDIKKRSSKARQHLPSSDNRHSVQLQDRRKTAERRGHEVQGSQPIMVASVALGKDPKKARTSTCLLINVTLKLLHCDRTVVALLDPDAEANVVSGSFARKEGIQLDGTTDQMHTFDGQPVPVYGQCLLSISAVDRDGLEKTFQHELFAAKCDQYDIILGHPWAAAVDADCDRRARRWRYRKTSEPTMRRRAPEPLVAESAGTMPPAASGRRAFTDQRHNPRSDSCSPDSDRDSPVDRRESSPDQQVSRHASDVRDVRTTRDPQGMRSSRHPRDVVNPRNMRHARDARDARDTRDPRHTRDAGNVQNPRDSQHEQGQSQGTRRDQAYELSQLSRTTSYKQESVASTPRSAARPSLDRADVERQVMIRLRDAGAQVTQSQLDQAVETAMQRLSQHRQSQG